MKIKDIAQKAGVSTATVSNVINGNRHKVSQATYEKVQQIIAEMGYNPSATARSLASKKSKIIGVVVSNIGNDDHFFGNPHYAHLLALLEKHIRDRGYYMMLRCVDKCRDIIPLFSSWNVDGMIFFGTVQRDVHDVKNSISVPAVFIDTYAADEVITNVGIDDYKGGYLSAQYLIEKGHWEIAFVGPGIHNPGVTQQRYQGFCDACAAYGIELPEDHIFDTMTCYQSGVEVGRLIATSWISFTAVAVMSDIAAFGVMEGLRREGKWVPDDVSVIGFDNLLECQYSYPKLTTISQNIEQKAERVANCLFRMIMDGETDPVSERNDVEVVERASVIDINK